MVREGDASRPVRPRFVTHFRQPRLALSFQLVVSTAGMVEGSAAGALLEGPCGDHGVAADEKVGMTERTWTGLVMRISGAIDGDQTKACVSFPRSCVAA